MKIRPLHDWAVIRRIEAGEKSSGGIIIPDSAREKPSEGTIVAIGPGVYKPEKGKEKEKKKVFVPTVLKPGQHVAFVDYMARDFTVDGNEVTMIREDDILGTYNRAGAHHLVPKKENAVSIKHDHPVSVQAVKGVSAVAKKEDQPAALKPSPAPQKQKAKKKPAAKKKAASPTKPVRKAPKKSSPAKKKGTKKTAGTDKKKAGTGKAKPAAKKAVAKKKTGSSRPKKSAPVKNSALKKKTKRKK